MKKFTNPLDNIRVASPCPANWDEMLGDGRKRFCSECSLNVYNLSAMTRDEAENFILTSEGRVCVRFYRRTDGTVLTEDCPVGWQAVKRRASRAATAFVSLCAGIFAGIFAFNQPKTETMSDAGLTSVQYVAPPTGVENVESPDSNLNFEEFKGEPEFPGMYTAGMPVNVDALKKDIKKKRKR